MADTLFGDKYVTQDEFEIVFSGDKFDSSIEIGELIAELNAVEKIIKTTVPELRKRELAGADLPKFEILVTIEKGSIKQKVKVIYEEKTTFLVLSAVVGPMIVGTYLKYLDYAIPDYAQREDIADIVEENKQLRSHLADLISPIATHGGEVTFNFANTSRKFNGQEATLIKTELESKDESEDEVKRNGVFLETSVGTIRKIDLDNKNHDYFGFNIENGDVKVPMSIDGEFNFNEYRALLDRPVTVTGEFKYKDDVITHIKLKNITTIDTTEQLSADLVEHSR